MEYLKKSFNKGISFLSAPSDAFEGENSTKFGDAFKYVLVLAIVTTVLSAIISAFSMNFANSFIPSLPPEATAFTNPGFIFVSSLIMGYIGLVVGLLIGGLWIHLWVYIIGGRKGLEQTMKSVFYGGTPNYLLGWIPFINILAGIWSLVLTWMGITRYQGLTGGKAALAIIIALIIPIVIGGMIFVALLSTLMALGMLQAGAIPGF